jgi:hypothetical protein
MNTREVVLKKTQSQYQVTIEYARSPGMSIEEVRGSFDLIIDLRTTTRLFVKHYGHLFPVE